MTNYILIDGSYYIFYRYYAVNIWWKHTEGAEPLKTDGVGGAEPLKIDGDGGTEPLKTDGVGGAEPLVEKFKSTFISKIHDIDKKLKLKNTIKYVGKDCRRSEIWRTALYPAYKATRGSTNDFLGAHLFDIAYGGGTAPRTPVYVGAAPVCEGAVTHSDSLFEKAGVKQILSYPSLEADDCIALFAKHLYKTEPDAHIWIIASDMDYLQITNDRIHLYDLKFKNICEKSSGDPKCDLFCKIVAGDKSDNIPSIFKKCGIKTALKYYNDKELFEKKLAADKEAQALYQLNTTLVDFNCIPTELVEGFLRGT